MDRHTIAWISIAGSLLGVLGPFYLAYDLLGGEHGPLRTLISAIRGAGFAIGASYLFGPSFGTALGVLGTAGQVALAA